MSNPAEQSSGILSNGSYSLELVLADQQLTLDGQTLNINPAASGILRICLGLPNLIVSGSMIVESGHRFYGPTSLRSVVEQTTFKGVFGEEEIFPFRMVYGETPKLSVEGRLSTKGLLGIVFKTDFEPQPKPYLISDGSGLRADTNVPSLPDRAPRRNKHDVVSKMSSPVLPNDNSDAAQSDPAGIQTELKQTNENEDLQSAWSTGKLRSHVIDIVLNRSLTADELFDRLKARYPTADPETLLKYLTIVLNNFSEDPNFKARYTPVDGKHLISLSRRPSRALVGSLKLLRA